MRLGEERSSSLFLHVKNPDGHQEHPERDEIVFLLTPQLQEWQDSPCRLPLMEYT